MIYLIFAVATASLINQPPFVHHLWGMVLCSPGLW